MGISIVYQPKMPSLNVNGATIPVGDKLGIVLTDQRGFYPTLWFALIHELHHVLFDWDYIIENGAHVSSDDVDLYTKEHMEEKADKFARDYLFSDEKMEYIQPYLKNKSFVAEFAKQNHIHPSIIYSFNAWDQHKKGDKMAWARVREYMPDISVCIDSLPKNPLEQSARDSAFLNKELFFNI